MNPATIATVRQLLDIAPVVFATPHFAIVCVQGSGRPPRDCISDSSSLSDQEAVLCAADSGIGQQCRHHP
ncbi:hypothetical protein KBZ12_17870, partial [Cyanobium sp. Cruz CV13-4-11]|uniref:hypothetical protein n=1 Tax=unclassified Cyanobium TaxID=2627006 RepID=UPI0020CCFA55